MTSTNLNSFVKIIGYFIKLFIMIGIALLIILFFASRFSNKSRFEYIDNIMTLAQYEKIKIGMTYDEVRTIIGYDSNIKRWQGANGFSPKFGAPVGGTDSFYHTWVFKDSSWVTVIFRNGTVNWKNEEGLNKSYR